MVASHLILTYMASDTGFDKIVDKVEHALKNFEKWIPEYMQWFKSDYSKWLDLWGVQGTAKVPPGSDLYTMNMVNRLEFCLGK